MEEIKMKMNFSQMMESNNNIFLYYRLTQHERLYNSDIDVNNKSIKYIISEDSNEKNCFDPELKRAVLLKEANDILINY